MNQGYFKSIRPFLPVILIMIGWFWHPFGKWADGLFFTGALLALLGAAFYSYRRGITQEKESEAVRLKQFLSYQRHDWMNDVQVLLGYLTLKKYERMHQYLDQQVQRANNERLITQLGYPPLTLALITLPQRYLQWKMNIKIEDISEYTYQEEKKMLSVIQRVFPWLERQWQDVVMDLQLKIRISKKEQMTLTISIVEESDKGPISILMHDLAQMRKAIKKWNGELVFIQEQNKIQITI